MNWKEYRLAELYNISSGLSKSSDQFGFGRPFLTFSDVFNNAYIPSKLSKLVNSSEKEQLSCSVLKGDVFLTRTSETVEELGMSSVALKDYPMATFNGFTKRLRPKKAGFPDPRFIGYYLRSPFFRAEVTAYSTLITRASLNNGIIERLKVNLPGLPTQRKIASILSAYDELIANNTQRIQLLEDMAEELYKEWFVRLRFPATADQPGWKESTFYNTDGKAVSHGTLGALPEGWEIIRLRNCISHYIGGGWGEELPVNKHINPAFVLRGTDIPDFNKGNINYEVLRYHTSSNLSSRTCQANDIIFEVSGGTEGQSLGRTSFVSKTSLDRLNHPLIPASFCKLIRVNDEIISPFYIYTMLKKMYKTGELKVYQVQSTGISNYQFEDFISATKVVVPAKSIQEKFDKLTQPLLEETQILGAKNQLLQETRDLLLPRLISGKLSVNGINLDKPQHPTEAAVVPMEQ